MRRVVTAIAIAVAASAPGAQVPTADTPFRIVRNDPALDAIIPPGATLELLAEGFGLLEGPVWIRDGADGYLVFSDMTANVIYKWHPKAGVSVYRENSGYTGDDPNDAGQQTKLGRSTVFLLGSNGLALDRQGRLVVCAMADRTVVRIEKGGTQTVVADRYQDKRFNGPNDVI